MSLLTRGSSLRPVPPADDARVLASPPASRQRRSRWRDPRMWLGVVLVVGSVVAGAKVLASADDTVAVWQLVRDVPSGAVLGGSDVRTTQVHFAEPAVAGQYVRASAALVPGEHATRDLHAGEMLSVGAVSSADSPLRRQLPLGVAAPSAPADLRPGDHVEVWAVPPAGRGAGSTRPVPALVLPDVVVLSVGGSVSGVSGERQVLVGLEDDADVATILRQVSGAEVVLVRLAG